MNSTVLIIDSFTNRRQQLHELIQNMNGFSAISLSNTEMAMEYLLTDTEPKPNSIIFDISGNEEYKRLLKNIKLASASIPVVVLVGFGDNALAMEAIQAGAQDFLYKPLQTERLWVTLRNIASLQAARKEAEWLYKDHHHTIVRDQIISDTKARAHFPLSGFLKDDGHVPRLSDLEAYLIRYAMQFYHGRMSEVARRLGIGRSTLYRKLHDFNIQYQEEAA